ncbi:MAG: A/G-specific adenine glycosylase [Pseudomonadota bacterium]
MTEAHASSFADALLAWAATYGRHDLPWQRDRTAYRVWVSEIMLQQTQVATVVPYYERFMRRFPDVRTLATAPQDEVLHHWSGLGYYARARNLHAAARLIMAKHGGEFPDELEQVHALPGVGRSTAGAVLTLARGQRHPILDGNVKRVLTRYHLVEGWPGDPKVERQLWAHAEDVTPAREHAGAYTQAIMDLGAMVCKRTRPLCGGCPVAEGCAARAEGRQEEFPHKRPRKGAPLRAVRMLVVLRDDARQVLLERRPPAGIWGGLWSFPEQPLDDDPGAWVESRLQVRVQSVEHWPVVRHTFSHYALDITPTVVHVAQAPDGVMDGGASLWYNVGDVPEIGLAAPVEKLLLRLGESASQLF